jgi:DNA-binding Lrp family transcriptional regulator
MTTAYVFIQISSGSPVDALSSIRQVEQVKQAHLVLGPTDIIAFVEVADMEALGEAIMAILAVDEVGHTDTRLAWPF